CSATQQTRIAGRGQCSLATGDSQHDPSLSLASGGRCLFAAIAAGASRAGPGSAAGAPGAEPTGAPGGAALGAGALGAGSESTGGDWASFASAGRGLAACAPS